MLGIFFFYFWHHVQTGFGAHPTFCPWVEWPECEADY